MRINITLAALLFTLKLLQPTHFNGYIESGGSTMPWKVLLLDEEVQIEYIVKMFSEKATEQQHPVTKEVIGSLLATELGLFTPDIALVNFDEFFVDNVLDDKAREILTRKHSGLKFASRYQDGMSIFSPAKHKRHLRMYDLANIFAFDCLIYNIDRGRRPDKPNLLVEDDNYLLIDHEQCFPFIDNEPAFYDLIMRKFGNSELDYLYQQHLLYPIIKSYNFKSRDGIFSEFEEYLTKLNVNKIRDTILDLHELNISTGQHDRLIDYLCYAKDNAHNFCRILLSCTQ
jgi:hypothetical protein